jgi:hypothetical protein
VRHHHGGNGIDGWIVGGLGLAIGFAHWTSLCDGTRGVVRERKLQSTFSWLRSGAFYSDRDRRSARGYCPDRRLKFCATANVASKPTASR